MIPTPGPVLLVSMALNVYLIYRGMKMSAKKRRLARVFQALGKQGKICPADVNEANAEVDGDMKLGREMNRALYGKGR